MFFVWVCKPFVNFGFQFLQSEPTFNFEYWKLSFQDAVLKKLNHQLLDGFHTFATQLSTLAAL